MPSLIDGFSIPVTGLREVERPEVFPCVTERGGPCFEVHGFWDDSLALSAGNSGSADSRPSRDLPEIQLLLGSRLFQAANDTIEIVSIFIRIEFQWTIDRFQRFSRGWKKNDLGGYNLIHNDRARLLGE
jgi:hypothetical protein